MRFGGENYKFIQIPVPPDIGYYGVTLEKKHDFIKLGKKCKPMDVEKIDVNWQPY